MEQLQPKTIKWGIIGLGKIANKFAQDLSTVKHAKLYAVASRDLEKAKSFAKQYSAPLFYNSYEELAKDLNIDAVYIATPHSFHKEHTILCLNHKKAVLCEKPFAMSLMEVEEMIAVAKANNVLLMEAMWTYFLPHFQFVLNELKSKRCGNITKLEADFGFKPIVDFNSRVFKKALGGGSLLDIGIYPIFAALSTMGKPVDIDAKATFFENGVDSSCDIIFNYNNGVKAFLKSSLLEKTPTEAIFHCEKGIIKINSRFQEPTTVATILNGKEEDFNFDASTNGYNFEILHFNELLRNYITESPIMSFGFSSDLMKILDDVRQLINLDYE
ncbi:MAG: Gfo/Idh/MocA family oxidoreductase [Aquaticitalea sp.]